MCQTKYPYYVFDFHHTDPSEKLFGLSVKHFAGNTMEKINKEMGKCVMLCANCHRITHYNNGIQS